MIRAFEDYELDPQRFELRCGDRQVKVEPRVFSLLAYLVENRDRVVSRNELLTQFWPGEFVSDAALSYCVKAARKAVGDDGTAQRVIQTLHRRGFRFVATVADGQPQPPRSSQLGADSAAPPTAPFVGREAVIGVLQQALDGALGGHGRLMLLVGEPGIGKTRTAEELSRHARQRGFNVLFSRCHESEGAPAFWPWVQLLRAYARSADPVGLRQRVGAIAPDVVHLLPELCSRSGTTEPPAPLESAEARFRLFDHVTRLLQAAAIEQPLALIVDDLHWADKSSLLLLQFLIREASDTPLLVAVTYRDTDIGPQHALTDALGDLVRVPGCERIALSGLSEADVAQLLAHSAGGEPEPSLVRSVHEETEGNPFFVAEVVRLLMAERRPADALAIGPLQGKVPPTVREAILRRLDRMSAECNRALRLASVIGREIPLSLLTACWRSAKSTSAANPVAKKALLQALDDARAARILEDAPAPGSVRFVHALIRETLYDGLSSPERALLHASVAGELRRAHGKATGPHLNALAHHFIQATPLGNTRDALDYSLRAGHYAASQLAFEEAAVHFEHALMVLPDTAVARQRTEILLSLGANLWRAGNFERARTTFWEAAERARACRSPQLLSQAALGFGGGFRGFNFGVIEPPLIELLEEALRRLPRRSSTLQAQIMARLAVALQGVDGSWPRREALSLGAVNMAKCRRDDAAHLGALSSRHWATWAPDNLADRRATAATMVNLSRSTGNLEMALQAHRFHLIDSLEAADSNAVNIDLGACADIAERLRQPYYTWYVSAFRALRAFLNGAFEESEQFSQEALRVGQQARSDNVTQAFGAQMLALRREQGRIGEVEPVLRGLVERYPAVPGWRCGFAYVLSELGREDEARAQLERLAKDDFAIVPRDAFWLVAMTGIAETCAFLGDVRRAVVLYRLLAPFRDNMAVNLVGTCVSSVARCLGRLSTLGQRWDEAFHHFDRAIAVEQGLGARPLLAHTHHDYGEALLARGAVEDSSRAVQLLTIAFGIYEQLGMRSFAAQAAAELKQLRS